MWAFSFEYTESEDDRFISFRIAEAAAALAEIKIV